MGRRASQFEQQSRDNYGKSVEAFHTPPSFHNRSSNKQTLPSWDSFPRNRSVLLKMPEDVDVDWYNINGVVLEWIKYHDLKLISYQSVVLEDKGLGVIFMFKKPKHALLFKLAWG